MSNEAQWCYSVQINRGPVQSIQVRSGLLDLAVYASLAMLEYDASPDGIDLVKIWSPEELVKYNAETNPVVLALGPRVYFHAWDGRTLVQVAPSEGW